MFENWSIKKIFSVLGSILLIILIIQIYMYIKTQLMYVHFILSFCALFIALLLFHSINVRIKKQRKNR